MKVGIGQDSHAFDFENKTKKLMLAGIEFINAPPLFGNSDADVILHALTNAISGVTGVNILGSVSDDMCFNKSITDSREYVKEAIKYLKSEEIVAHISFSIECLTPKISPMIPQMKVAISELLDISEDCIGITVTTGEGLTAFGKGLGIQTICIITVE
ncbi:MAG TPA: 2-C-methyl-D-erythritol 2,4-cyclodiphosphate synthase [Clostridia bacterium]|nr:2-C-methyl-D-erythritol 2,4-cyclodiphosphate synthase [Clostridia bacterium]